MMYQFEVFALIATIVFGITGTIMMTLVVLKEAREYARARQVIRRITSPLRGDNLEVRVD